MNVFGLALANIRHQRLQVVLQTALLTLGTAAMVLIVLVGRGLEDSIKRDLGGIDLVVGAKGSPLQLILSSIYQLDVPTGNIPRDEAERIARHTLVAMAVPIALGDSFVGARIVGTTPEYLALYDATLAQGAMFAAPMEAVLGSAIAARTGLRPGDHFVGAHGLTEGGGEHTDQPYRVVGILARTGTVVDRLVVTSLESVWDIHSAHDHADEYDPASEITALLIRFKSPLAALQLPRFVNTQTALQAASPATETARLFSFLGLGRTAFQLMGGAFIALAGLSIFAGLYATFEQRRYDLAIMRALGATRARVFSQILVEASLIGLAGTFLGLFIAHVSAELITMTLGLASQLPIGGDVFYWQELGALAIGPLAAGAAAILPALRAYRLDIASTLQLA